MIAELSKQTMTRSERAEERGWEVAVGWYVPAASSRFHDRILGKLLYFQQLFLEISQFHAF